MAFPVSPTTQSAQLVRQKTYMINRNPGVFYALKALFLHLAANRGNPDLRLVNIDGLATASDGGNADQVIADGPCTIYAVYAKLASTATAATTFLKASDSATTASPTAPEFEQEFNVASQEFLFLYPNGWPMTAGFTIEEDTTSDGSVRNLTVDRVDGFVIFGA